jgi:hypothetical protein
MPEVSAGYILGTIGVITLIIATVLVQALKGSLRSYFDQKAQNLATKQDIAS